MPSLAERIRTTDWIVGLSLGVVAIVAASVIPEEWPPVPYAAGTAATFGVIAALGAALLKCRASTIAMLIAAPVTVFLLSSVLFAGNVVAFFRHDILVLLGAVTGAFAGAYLGKLARQTGSAV